MVLVLFFLSLISVILFLLFSVLWLQIDIKQFNFYKEEKKEKRINDDYEIIINCYVFRKIKIFSYKINRKKFSKKYFQNIKNKVDLSILKSFIFKNLDFSNIKFIELEKFKFNFKVGTENVILTSGIVTIFNTLISVLLVRIIKNYNSAKYFYNIEPIYNSNNFINFSLDLKIKIRLFSFIKAYKIYIKSKKTTFMRNKIQGKMQKYNLYV